MKTVSILLAVAVLFATSAAGRDWTFSPVRVASVDVLAGPVNFWFLDCLHKEWCGVDEDLSCVVKRFPKRST